MINTDINSPQARVALLIDADNIREPHADEIFKHVSTKGNVIVRRAYGVMNSPFPWGKDKILLYAIEPVARFVHVSGKNVTDIALVIGALDLAYRKIVDTICIASNDSDFALLAMKLRELDIRVYGIGTKGAQKSFRNSCDEFYDLSSLEKHVTKDSEESYDNMKDSDISIHENTHDMEEATKIFRDAYARFEDGTSDRWVGIERIAKYIKRVHPDFSAKNYGYERPGGFLRLIKATGIFEYNDDEKTSHRIRIKIFEIYSATDGLRWRLKDGNHQIIATGGEAFSSEDAAEESIKSILEEIDCNTPIVKEGSPQDGSANTRFTYFVGKDDEYYWRLQNKGNNAIIAVGGEGFQSESNVIRSVENVRGEIVKNLPIERVYFIRRNGEYCVNKNAQKNGDHEVHLVACTSQWLPKPENRLSLGSHADCHSAVKKAKKRYPKADGCAHCCPDCHTS